MSRTELGNTFAWITKLAPVHKFLQGSSLGTIWRCILVPLHTVFLAYLYLYLIFLAYIYTAPIVWSTVLSWVWVVGALVEIMAANLDVFALLLRESSMIVVFSCRSGSIRNFYYKTPLTPPWKPVKPGLQGQEKEPTLLNEKMWGNSFLGNVDLFFSQSQACKGRRDEGIGKWYFKMR